MLVSFLESIKYVGHLFPISFLRIYMGYFYFQLAIEKIKTAYLFQPQLATQISESILTSPAPAWYKFVALNLIVPHWQIAAIVILSLELAIGVSYLIGYLVRPIGILAVLLSLNLFFLTKQPLSDLYIAIHFLLAWIGAGRCLGVDYYFYKRQRGLLW